MPDPVVDSDGGDAWGERQAGSWLFSRRGIHQEAAFEHLWGGLKCLS